MAWDFKCMIDSDEIITLSDSPLEHLNVVPLASSATPEPPNKNIPSWAPLVRHSTTSDPSPSPRYLPAPVRHISPASEAELERAGFDPLEGSSVRYPANEYLRQYEMDIVKSCVAVNSTISLPLAVSADHISAVVIVNFLRWFPRSRAVFCCNSLDAAKMFKERGIAVGIAADEISIVDTFNTFKKMPTHEIGRVCSLDQSFSKALGWFPRSRAIFCCNSLDAAEMFKERGIAVGIAADEISIVDTFNTFKKMPTHEIGRVIVTTPQTLEKIVESESTVIEDIRCMVLNLDASDTRITKSASVPLGISTEYCSTIEVLSETQSFIEKWLERGVSYLEKLHDIIPLPSTKPEHLFNLDWGQIAAKANSSTDETIQLVVNCMFLVESARNLIVNGPRIFYLYCVDLFGNAEQNPRACNVQQMILADATLSKIYEKIQSKYGYGAGSIFDITYNNLSANSHPKFSRLNKVLEKSPSPLRCLVLCENEFVSRVVCESLSNTSRFRSAIVRVVAHPGPPAEFSKYHRLPTQCTGLFSRPGDDVIVVLGMDIADATNVIDTACSNELHLVVSMDRR
ncbi:hypothetical protein ANCDUO_11352 [Ancylostoma duodenale]|uniref:Uncharacterized protein n=1 Tax=Ancylostoma duodenale TaxID=51022 RepID=A0A0C2GBQ4_9BILA|nr:hypothetical protein ANCDUO_11352 [Ancylostoma duodenale]